MAVYIRRAEQADRPAIVRLLRQIAALHREGRPDIFKKGSAKYSEKELAPIIRDDLRPVFVAEDGSTREVCGYVFCALNVYENKSLMIDHKSLFIDDICVDEARRGRGIGKLLFSHVRDYAKAQGCHNITLNVWTFNENAAAFYKSLGMEPQKICMELRLDE